MLLDKLVETSAQRTLHDDRILLAYTDVGECAGCNLTVCGCESELVHNMWQPLEVVSLAADSTDRCCNTQLVIYSCSQLLTHRFPSQRRPFTSRRSLPSSMVSRQERH